MVTVPWTMSRDSFVHLSTEGVVTKSLMPVNWVCTISRACSSFCCCWAVAATVAGVCEVVGGPISAVVDTPAAPMRSQPAGASVADNISTP